MRIANDDPGGGRGASVDEPDPSTESIVGDSARAATEADLPNAADSSDAPLIYLVAGEHSGDNLAARLMAALKRQSAGDIRFAGVGGPGMAREGLESLFPLSDLAVMGFAEILPHAPLLLHRLRETAEDITRLRPTLVITVDSPGFSFRLARRLRGSGIPVFHYVAPQLWAWLPSRGRKLSGLVDHIMALLPFEPGFFADYDVPCTYVGHPTLESGAGRGDGKAFRARHGIDQEATVISVLPGSRLSETKRLLPIFAASLAMMKADGQDMTVVISTVASVRDAVTNATRNWPFPTIVITDPAQKYDAFAASDVALTKSGTVTLELALAGVPMVVCYRVNLITAAIARCVLRVKNVALVNILAEQMVAPELLQFDCVPRRISAEVMALLRDPSRRNEQLEGLKRAVDRLGKPSPLPSERAAAFVLDAIDRMAAGGQDKA